MFNWVNKYCPAAYWYFILSLLVHILIIIGNILLGTFTFMSAVLFVVVIAMISFWAYIINVLCTYNHTYIAWAISGFTLLSVIPSILLTFISDVSLIIHPKIKNLTQSYTTTTNQNQKQNQNQNQNTNMYRPHLDL